MRMRMRMMMIMKIMMMMMMMMMINQIQPIGQLLADFLKFILGSEVERNKFRAMTNTIGL